MGAIPQGLPGFRMPPLQIDASGEEVIRHLVERLRDSGIEVVFTGLYELIGEANFYRTEEMAMAAILAKVAAPGGDDPALTAGKA